MVHRAENFESNNTGDVPPLLLKALPAEAKGKYNTNDPVSIILYAIRKEINPKSNITREEMACIDPSQYEMRIDRHKKQ